MSVRATVSHRVDAGRTWARAAAIGGAASFLLLLIPGVWLEVLERNDSQIRDSPAEIAIYSLAILTAAIVGAFLALRRPENAIGWLLMALGWVWAVGGTTDVYASYSLLQRHTPLPGARAVASLGTTRGHPSSPCSC